MRVPQQVSDRLKEVPAQALRGVFAGIGQLLLITDKLRNKTPADQQVPQSRGPEPSETITDPAPSAPAAPPAPTPGTAPAAETAPETKDPGKTGNVRLLGDGERAPATTAGAPPQTAAAEATTPADVTTQAAPERASAPLPNYDALSIASLRARLRNLDIGQVRALAEYERSHAGRADVIAMFDRRIAKLEAEGHDLRGEASAEGVMEAQDEVDVQVKDDVEAEAEGET
jgi:hypothetical protein